MSELERGASGHGRAQVDPLRMKRSMEAAGGRADMADATVLKRQEKPLAPCEEREVEERQLAQEQDVADKPTQAHIPAADPVRRPAPPTAGSAARELRIKVWPQEDSALAEGTQSEKEQKRAGSTRTETGIGSAGTDTAVNDLPTRPLVATPPTPTPSVQRAATPPSTLSSRQESVVGDVDRLDTTPLLAPESGRNRSVSSSAYVPVERAGQVGQRPWQVAGRRDSLDYPSLHAAQPVTPPSRPIVQSQQARGREFVQQPVSPVPPVSPASSVQERGRAPLALPLDAVKTGAAHRPRRSGRTPLVVLLAALAILIFGGLGAWIIVFHPFTVPVVTQPRQTFSNTQLGLSVQYPSGWTARANANNGTVIFSDSSHTGQVRMLVTAVSGDLNQYLSKEAAQLGMSGVKPGSTLSFAGTSWQQVQGSLQVSGANYTAVLLAGVHGSHIYTIIQMAPQVTYTDEEHIIFSPMRSSFHFLP